MGACGTRSTDRATPGASVDHATPHRFFPLDAGTAWLYVGTKDGRWHEERVRVGSELVWIEGRRCTPRIQEVFIDGQLDHVTTEWFALDVAGNVWKCGEETRGVGDAPERAEPERWLAGVDGARAWLFLPAHPQVGDELVGDGTDHAIERRTVLALGVTERTPAGTFGDCVAVRETEDDDLEDQDLVLYAPGIGKVSETHVQGRIALVVPAGTPR